MLQVRSRTRVCWWWCISKRGNGDPWWELGQWALVQLLHSFLLPSRGRARYMFLGCNQCLCAATLLPSESQWALEPWQLGQVWPGTGGTGDAGWNLFYPLRKSPGRAGKDVLAGVHLAMSPECCRAPIPPPSQPAPCILCVCAPVSGPRPHPCPLLSPLSRCTILSADFSVV